VTAIPKEVEILNFLNETEKQLFDVRLPELVNYAVSKHRVMRMNGLILFLCLFMFKQFLANV